MKKSPGWQESLKKNPAVGEKLRSENPWILSLYLFLGGHLEESRNKWMKENEESRSLTVMLYIYC